MVKPFPPALTRRPKQACLTHLPPVFFFTDERRVDTVEVLARLPAGTGVILRDYDRADRRRWCRTMVGHCRFRRLVPLVAGDWRLARSVGAAGVHLPEAILFAPPPMRRPGWIVTAAAHSVTALRRAAVCGADAAFLSPVFTTASHPGRPALGAHRFARLAASARLPVYALGGIDARSMKRLPAARICGFGAIALFSDNGRISPAWPAWPRN